MTKFWKHCRVGALGGISKTTVSRQESKRWVWAIFSVVSTSWEARKRGMKDRKIEKSRDSSNKQGEGILWVGTPDCFHRKQVQLFCLNLQVTYLY